MYINDYGELTVQMVPGEDPKQFKVGDSFVEIVANNEHYISGTVVRITVGGIVLAGWHIR